MVRPAAAGLRWPAEWELHRATWLSWPHNRETWPHELDRVEAVFAAMVRALWLREEVCINVSGDAMEEAVRKRLRQTEVDPDRGIRFFPIPTNDAWVRDYGPIFLVGEGDPGTRERALVDFGFDAWGGKYPPWDRDDAVPRRIGEALGIRRYPADRVLEGGSVDGNGRGTLLTTRACLLHSNRGGGQPRSRDDMEKFLAAELGAKQLLWLDKGLEGDDTDGHIDDIARFVAEDRVVAAVEDDSADANHAPLLANLERLRGMCNAAGKMLEVIPLPMPPRIVVRGERCPASYANFYLANGVALVPTFDAPSDERALAILAECLPGREIIPVPSRDLIVGLGAVHCLTQQEPA